MLRSSIASLVALSVACSSSHQEAAAGTGGSGGGGACWDVASACPSSPPYEGSPCDLPGTCSYPPHPYEYSCPAGRWAATCMANADGQTCVPPFGESCASPSSTPLSDAIIEIGAGDSATAFAPLADGAKVDVIWGGQGSPMVAFRVRVTGSGVGDCALVAHKLALGPYQGAEYKTAVRLHCGESLVVYDILPIDQACPNPPVPSDVTLTVKVFGKEQSLKLDWANAACPKGGGFG
ncbi:MAG: hypothetical protein L6Q84_32195 [Polyangiaceae bacterium]|nr:hypothetical protein [Polyangiaceae bacterium]